jgi:hypothetical protein
VSSWCSLTERGQRVPGAVLLAVVVALSLGVGSAQAAGRERLTVYAVPTTAQFMNHADDRVRGMTTNPFNVNTKALALVIITGNKEKGNGPFPGDDILYTFKLYTDAGQTKRAGSAIFTCYYNFAKRAICDSYFDLHGGLVLASGLVVFNSTHFTLSVTGGNSKFLGVRGQVNAAPAAKNVERLDLVLLDLPK